MGAVPAAVSHLIGHRYRLLNQLGAGGMGAVFRAHDVLTDEVIALKRVTTATNDLMFATRAPGLVDDGLRYALAQEFRTLASLRHPNIIRVLDYGFDELRQPYLTMDLLVGAHDLRTAARDLPLHGKIGLIIQVLQALAYLHQRGVIHRDLKPDNVLVVNGHVRVLDFGLAVARERLGEGAGTAGTLKYMAPEVLQGQAATEAADLYALGVMLYEVIVGRHPFNYRDFNSFINDVIRSDPDLTPLVETTASSSISNSITLDRLPDPTEESTAGSELITQFQSDSSFAVPPRMDDWGGRRHDRVRVPTLLSIVSDLLAKSPAERYHDANHVIEDLRRALALPPEPESSAIRESYLQAAQFVGRQPEMECLIAALDRASKGQGSLWLVGGESGVGKSRLVDELRTHALVQGALLLRGQGVANRGQPYQIWRDPLRRLVIAAAHDPADLPLIKALVPDLDELLAAAGGGEMQLSAAEAVDGAVAQLRLAQIIAAALRQQDQPVVMVLEDLHWAFEGMEILKPLARVTADLPVLVVGTYRNDERPNLPEELPEAQTIILRRLENDEIQTLVTSMIGQVEHQDSLMRLLAKETEGNAFFLVEVLRELAQEAGSLHEIGRESLPPRVLAGGVQQIIRRRLDSTPADARALLKIAAVAGREIDAALLQYLIDQQPDLLMGDLDTWLTRCGQASVLEAVEGRWRFAHDKLREAVLDDLTDDERWQLNGVVALGIEAVYPDRLDSYAAALANHWHEAGDYAKAANYGYTAGKQSYEACAYPESQAQLEQALADARQADPSQLAQSIAQICEALGKASYSFTNYERSREVWQEALRLYQAENDLRGISEALNGIGEIHMRQSEFSQATELFEQGLEIRRQLGSEVEIGYSYMNLGVVAYQTGDGKRARELFQMCYDILSRVGSPRDHARAINNLANAIDQGGDLPTALEMHKRALAIREQERDLHGISFSLINMSAIELDLEHLDEARAYAERAYPLVKQMGERAAEAALLNQLGQLADRANNTAKARSYHLQALEVRKKLNERMGMTMEYVSLGKLEASQLNVSEARRYFKLALDLAEELNNAKRLLSIIFDVVKDFPMENREVDGLALLLYVRAEVGENWQIHYKEGDAEIGQLEAILTHEQIAEARERGAQLTLEDALALTRDYLGEDQAPAEFIIVS